MVIKRVVIAAAGFLAATVVAASAGEYHLVIDEHTVNITGRDRTAMTINGAVPGPALRWREGEDVTLRVTNRLKESTSIHWHGLIVPNTMDGVPGISFEHIHPGATFTYHFTVKQNGTYWYHSHSGLQEQAGVYSPLIIDPAAPEPFHYDREYVVMLSDWTDEDPLRVLAKLKKRSGYYNVNKPTVGDLFREAGRIGWRAAWSDRLAWGRMRMDPTDIADVTGATYTFLVNGRPPQANWTALFTPGERVRLRFINASSMTYFDLRIPGLTLEVVQADGQNIEPVEVDELRIAVSETYDVIVAPREDRAYTVFAEAMDRSGYARGTLAPRLGMSSPVPAMRPRPVRTMADMGMADGAHEMRPEAPAREQEAAMPGMDHGGDGDMGAMPGMNHDTMDQGLGGGMSGMASNEAPMVMHNSDTHGSGNAMVAMMPRSRLHEPGGGLERTGTRVLTYADLRAAAPRDDRRPPEREIELHLTGNMERYIWGFNGKRYAEAQPIRMRYGERLRVIFVNDTMMDHPLHLHGMWMELDNGNGDYNPRKFTINVKPGERLSFVMTADALGTWPIHCHLAYHMAAGMMAHAVVSDGAGMAHPAMAH
ncbi:MAG: copper resistance system multicopper oxidase [Nitrospirota bacterium]